MNVSLLSRTYWEASNKMHDSQATKIQKLAARKDAVLAELETAHLIVYQHRAKLAIEVEEAESARLKKRSMDDKKIIESYNENIPIGDRYFNSLNKNIFLEDKISSLETFSPKEEDPKKEAVKRLAFNLAQRALWEDNRLDRFRQKLDEAERRGDEVTLETLVTAAHNVSVSEPHSAPNFLATLESIPEQAHVDYANVVSHLFRDLTHPMGGNPLMSRLIGITPSSKKGNIRSSFFDRESDDGEMSFKEKYTSYNSKIRKDDVFLESYSRSKSSFEGLLPRDFDTSSSFLRREMQKKISDFYKVPQFQFNDNSNFGVFLEIENLNRQLGSDSLATWLRHTDELLKDNYENGRNFALGSRRTLMAYLEDLDWSFEQFILDYKMSGKRVFAVSGFTDKFEHLSKDRKQSLVRRYLERGDLDGLESLVNNDLPRESVAVVAASLPDNIDNDLFVEGFRKVSDLYKQWKIARIDESIVRRRLSAIGKVNSMDSYISAVGGIEELVLQYAAFVNEHRSNPNINLGFNDLQAQNTLDLYVGFLGKDFEQFRRDFGATGTPFQRLSDIKDIYGNFMDEERLRAVLNYVAKQRSRDLINDLVENTAPKQLIRSTISGLGKKAGKRDVAKALTELSKTYNFLRDVGVRDLEAMKILERRLEMVGQEGDVNNVFDAINGCRKERYNNVTGGLSVPEGLEDKIDNIVVAYYKNTGTDYSVDVQPALRLITRAYLQRGAEGAFDAIGKLGPNKSLRKKLRKQGVNVDAFKRGMQREYHVSTDKDSLTRIRQRIDSEVEQIYDRVGQLELEEAQLAELKEGSLREQLDKFEKFLHTYEFNDENKGLKLEVKGHIQTARSMTGTIKEMETDARFYVSTDPLESLHMGQYFGSCLSLSRNHGGVNSWASVVQTMDANKNVIYAKSEDGRYLGRNRTVLTDKGVLCTRFYQNGNMNLDEAWINYLSDFANHTGQDVMIPTMFVSGTMGSKLSEMVASGKVQEEYRRVRIEPAYFDAFYGDGLMCSKHRDGSIGIESKVYIVKPSGTYSADPKEVRSNSLKEGVKGMLSRIFSS